LGGIYKKLKYYVVLNMENHRDSVLDSTNISKYNYNKLQNGNESQDVEKMAVGLILTMRATK
jgi:hypothetical protein